MNEKIPAVLDWVKVRSECSILTVFKQLEAEIETDVRERQELLQPSERKTISYSRISDKRFCVMREDRVSPVPASRSVEFDLERNEIVVTDMDNQVAMTATITLNDEGRCMLKVGQREMEHWQFRRAALERIFFGDLIRSAASDRASRAKD